MSAARTGVRPLTGGSVTGNLFEALADVRLSLETRVNASYAGPVAIRFGSLQVAGGTRPPGRSVTPGRQHVPHCGASPG